VGLAAEEQVVRRGWRAEQADPGPHAPTSIPFSRAFNKANKYVLDWPGW